MTSVNSSSFAALLTQERFDSADRGALRNLKRRTLLPLAVVVALVALWCAIAPLSGAVVAPAQVKVELNRKTVQHKEGGIVREILVRDGQRVRAGQPLVVIGDVRSDSELSLLRDQLRGERIRNARAAAEAALQPQFDVPAEMASDRETAGHLQRERALFVARRRTLDEQIASLQAQIREAHAQAGALTAQIEATQTSTKLSAEEREINEKLVREGFIQRARLLQLERAEADYRSRLGESRSDLAVARQRIGELQALIAQARNQYQQFAADELKEASAKLREIEERLRPSQDQVERQFVRSPVDGRVMALRVSAVGEVIRPGEPLFDVVPSHEKLVVEARIRPEDVDHVHEGSTAEVRLATLDSRATSLLPARVTFVSPDRVTDAEGRQSWFVATVEVDAARLADRGRRALRAGMSAELYVTTAERTFFEYLAQPLDVFASRAMREP